MPEPKPPLPLECRAVAAPDDPNDVIPRHAVRADGVVFYWREAWSKWIPLKPKIGPSGHRKVWIRDDRTGRVRMWGIATLVARAWHGPRPLGQTVFHFPDPDPGNCRADNLRWAPEGTSRIGRTLAPLPPRLAGEAKGNARLTEESVREIRRLYREGWGYREIAADLEVSDEAVRHVLIGHTWSHVPDPYGPIVMRRRGPGSEWSPRARLDWETVRAIRKGHAAGRSYRQLAAESGISDGAIRNIIKGRTWKED
jgi:hypothetical protein